MYGSDPELNMLFIVVSNLVLCVTDMGFWSTIQHRLCLVRFNGLPEPWRVPPESWHLSRSCYINNSMHNAHPHSSHLDLARSQHPRRPQGFENLPMNRPGLGKLATRQSKSSLWYSYCLILITQLGRVSPYDYEVSPPRSGLLINAV